MNNTKNQSEFVPMPLSKLKEHLQSQMNNFGLDKWKVKTLADDWKYSYDVIVIKRMRIFCISIAFGISPKHFRTDVADAIDNIKSNCGSHSYANLKSIITNIDSYDSLYNKYKIKIMKT